MTWLQDLADADDVVTGAFGDPADHVISYAASGGEPVNVDGVFSSDYRVLDAGDAGIAKPHPTVFARVANLPSDPTQDDDEDGATVTVDGVDYYITEAEVDGQGGVRLHLHKR